MGCRSRILIAILTLWGLAGADRTPALAADPEPPPAAVPRLQTTVQVVATRLPEDVLDLAASVQVIQGDDIEARGVRDLAGALALAGGVAIAPGGDGGPASSVPELMGLREFDAFLLVVDGVPWGGAFNPALPTLDLTNVDRIEILRGPAPVLYGATSFVGVIHVIHRSPEDTPDQAQAWGGSYGSGGVAGTAALPAGGALRHSLSASLERQGYRDDRTGHDRAHALWRGALEAAGGDLTLAADLTAVRQDPASPRPRQGATLSPLVPLDANNNPSDARIDEDRIFLSAGYEHAAGAGTWTGTLALTHLERDSVRGFLVEDFDTVPPGSPDAHGYRQEVTGDDAYLDAHWSWQPGDLTLVAGADLLAGRREAGSENFQYEVALDGQDAPDSSDQTILERPEFEDIRAFAGAYALVTWTPAPRWRLDAGLRLNHTRERQEGEVETGSGEMMVSDDRTETRPSGSLGASFRIRQTSRSALWAYAAYTDAFKPAAVDLGPEAEGEILEPETAQTVEAGVKGAHLGGRLSWQASAYLMDFDNLVVARTVNGLPGLTNAGSQRFTGLEVAAHWQAGDDCTLDASYAHHKAEFRDYVAEFGGTPTQLAGNRLEMSPEDLAALGVDYHPRHGWQAHVTGNLVGPRYLDRRNTARAGSYTTWGAGVGYRFDHLALRLDAVNLSDARDPVSESELGESQYYLLPARQVTGTLLWDF